MRRHPVTDPGKNPPLHRKTLTLTEPYAPPQLRKLAREQGNLLLVGYAWQGSQNARELLDVLFPGAAEQVYAAGTAHQTECDTSSSATS